MNILTNIKTSLRIALLLSLVPFLFSCGGSESSSGSGSSNIDTDVALNSAAKNIAQVISTNADGLAGVGGDSEALASLLEPLGITLADNGDEGLSDSAIDFLDTLLDDKSAIISRNGDTITVRPAPTQTCDEMAISVGFAQDDQIYDDCIAAMDDYLISIQVEGDESGTLSMNFDGNVFVTVEYSATGLTISLNVEKSFAALESLMLVLDPESIFELPETLAGVLQLDLQALGEEHGSIQLAITKAIQVVDNVEGFDITIEPASLFSLEADGIAGTASISSSLNAIDAMLPVEAETLGEVAGDLALTGATISVNITDGGDGMDGNLSVGPLKFDIDNSGFTENIFNFVLDPEFSIDPVSGEITLDTALNLELTVSDDIYNILMGQSGSLVVDAPAGTTILDTGDGVFKIQSGSMNFAGTGDFVDMSGSLGVGDCFDIDGPASCPLL